MICVANSFYVLTPPWGWWHPAGGRADPWSVLGPLPCPVITLSESLFRLADCDAACRQTMPVFTDASWTAILGPWPTCPPPPPAPAAFSEQTGFPAQQVFPCKSPPVLPLFLSPSHTLFISTTHNSVYKAHPGLTTSQQVIWTHGLL